MLRTLALVLCLLTITLLMACSSNSTTKTENAAPIPATAPTPANVINHPRPRTSNQQSPDSNQQFLDQQLFNVVGEAELSQTPDDASAAIAAINAGANVNARNKLGDTPLLIAARNGRVNVLKVLLDKGADINAQDNRGQTALMVTVGNVAAGDGANDVKAVNLLLAKGADVNIKDNDGFTALSGSEGSNDPNYLTVRRKLKQAGAK